ncbi:MAG: hypothetical protein GKR95_02085 [Gammaproteobacteria bacterium]|nr:hypothetical protein [Gammaproteobacteria bacterium]
MSQAKRGKKGKSDQGSFLGLPHSVLRSTNYCKLSPRTRALLIEIAVQYDGKNNGNLSCPFSYLKSRGWRGSKATIQDCFRELEHFGLILRIQSGGLNCGGKKRPNLYALSWLNIQMINYSDGFTQKTDWKIGDYPGTWRQERPSMKPQKSKKALTQKKLQVQRQYRTGTNVVPIGAISQ